MTPIFVTIFVFGLDFQHFQRLGCLHQCQIHIRIVCRTFETRMIMPIERLVILKWIVYVVDMLYQTVIIENRDPKINDERDHNRV